MAKIGLIIFLFLCWLFATKFTVTVNGVNDEHKAWVAKSIFYWIAVIMAYSLGTIH